MRLNNNVKLLTISLIFLIGAFLRFYRINDDFILLYDQGRDLLAASRVLEGKLTLLGQQMGVGGIFYGPLYYYFLALCLFIFRGNPVGGSIIIITFNLLGVFLIYLLTTQLFSEKAGLISALLYSISYSLIAFSRWLTNPALVPPLSLLFLYFLINLSKNRNLFFILGLLTGVVFELEAPVAFFYPLIIILTIFLFRLKINFGDFIKFSLPFLLVISPHILFELRHNFLSTRGLLKFFLSDRGFDLNLTHMINSNTRAYLNIFSNLLTPSFPFITIILFILSFLHLIKIQNKKENAKKYKVLLAAIYTPLIGMFFYNRPFTPAHLIGVMPLYIILVSGFLENLISRRKLLAYPILLLFIFLNLYKYWKYENFVNYCPNINGINLKNQKEVVDFLYRDSEGKIFNYITYTIPYWKDEPWQYLFSWYGKNKFGYKPLKGEAKYFYVIIEGDPDNPNFLKAWRSTLNNKSKTIFVKKIGKVIVEKRELFYY